MKRKARRLKIEAIVCFVGTLAILFFVPQEIRVECLLALSLGTQANILHGIAGIEEIYDPNR